MTPWAVVYEGQGPAEHRMVERLLARAGVDHPLAWLAVRSQKVKDARLERAELGGRLAELAPARTLTLGAFALMVARGDETKPALLDERGRLQASPHGGLLMPSIPTAWAYGDPEYFRDLARDVMKWGTYAAPVVFEPPDWLEPQTLEELRTALATLKDEAVLALDVETSGTDPLRDELLSVGVGAIDGPVVIVPRATLALDGVADTLWAALWDDPLQRVVMHNAKFDLKFLARWWDALPSPDGARVGDTMLLSHLLDERPARSKYRSHGLKDLARTRYDLPDYHFDFETFHARLRGIGPPLGEADWDELHGYHAIDVRATAMLWRDLSAEALDESKALLQAHDNLLAPATLALAEAELRGVPIDAGYVRDERRILESRIARRDRALRSFLARYDGGESGDATMKLTSPTQMVDVVMRRFGVLPSKQVGFRTIADAGMAQYAKFDWNATGFGAVPEDRGTAVHWPNVGDKKGTTRGTYSKPMTPTDIGDMRALIMELLRLGRRHEARWIAAVLEQRLDMKYLSTYIEGFETGVGPDGRVHADFNIAGTVTGRLSSSNPNLHALPKRGKLKRFRRAVRAGPGRMLVEADYSQLELRVAAMLSGDEALRRVYEEGRDLHLEVASLMLGKPPEEITEPERYLAKAVDFGVIYGRGAGAIAKGDAMFYFTEVLKSGESWSVEKTGEFIGRFLDGYPQLRDWLDDVGEQVLETRVVDTPFGRRRRFLILEPVRRQVAAASARGEALGRVGAKLLNQKGINARVRTILRQAVNTPIQSTASDICLEAFSRLVTELDPRIAVPVSLVHDSVLVEARLENVLDVAATMIRVMETTSIDTHGVPIVVDVKIGKTLADEDMRKFVMGDDGLVEWVRETGAAEFAGDDKDPQPGEGGGGTAESPSHRRAGSKKETPH